MLSPLYSLPQAFVQTATAPVATLFSPLRLLQCSTFPSSLSPWWLLASWSPCSHTVWSIREEEREGETTANIPRDPLAVTPFKFLEEVEIKALKPTRQHFRFANLTTPSFSAALGTIFARRPLPTPSSVIVMHVCHGAGTRPAPTATAFAHRVPHVVFSVTGIADWDDTAGRAAADAWVPAVRADVEAAGLATGWKYSNFNPKEPGDGRLYLGADGVARLRRLKARYDPHRFFARSTHDLGE